MRARVEICTILYLTKNKTNLIVAGDSDKSRRRLMNYLRIYMKNREYTIHKPGEVGTESSCTIHEMELTFENNREMVLVLAEKLRLNIKEIRNKFEMLIECQSTECGEHYYLHVL